MINPLRSARTILERPEHAEPLFDLLVWVSEEMKRASDRAVFDKILEECYALTDHSIDCREKYKMLRKQEPEVAVTSTGS